MREDHHQNWPTNSTYVGIIRQGFKTNHKKYIKASSGKGRSGTNRKCEHRENTHMEIYVYMEVLDIFFFNSVSELSF